MKRIWFKYELSGSTDYLRLVCAQCTAVPLTERVDGRTLRHRAFSHRKGTVMVYHIAVLAHQAWINRAWLEDFFGADRLWIYPIDDEFNAQPADGAFIELRPMTGAMPVTLLEDAESLPEITFDMEGKYPL